MAWTVKPSAAMQIDRREQPYLTEAIKAHLTKVYLPRYETKQAALLPTLHAVQHEVGWLPQQALEEIAAFLGLAPAVVYDTASFYEEYWLEPKGDYVIAVCRSIACEVLGHEQITERVTRKLGIVPGETTDDGKFTLVELECLGSCGTAPVAMLNEELHENVTERSIEELIDSVPDIERPVIPEVTAETNGSPATAEEAPADGDGGDEVKE